MSRPSVATMSTDQNGMSSYCALSGCPVRGECSEHVIAPVDEIARRPSLALEGRDSEPATLTMPLVSPSAAARWLY